MGSAAIAGQGVRDKLSAIFFASSSKVLGGKTDLGNARMHLSRSLYVIGHMGRIPNRLGDIENSSG
jgi:hypothetical protein